MQIHSEVIQITESEFTTLVQKNLNVPKDWGVWEWEWLGRDSYVFATVKQEDFEKYKDRVDLPSGFYWYLLGLVQRGLLTPGKYLMRID